MKVNLTEEYAKPKCLCSRCTIEPELWEDYLKVPWKHSSLYYRFCARCKSEMLPEGEGKVIGNFMETFPSNGLELAWAGGYGSFVDTWGIPVRLTICEACAREFSKWLGNELFDNATQADW